MSSVYNTKNEVTNFSQMKHKNMLQNERKKSKGA